MPIAYLSLTPPALPLLSPGPHSGAGAGPHSAGAPGPSAGGPGPHGGGGGPSAGGPHGPLGGRFRIWGFYFMFIKLDKLGCIRTGDDITSTFVNCRFYQFLTC